MNFSLHAIYWMNNNIMDKKLKHLMSTEKNYVITMELRCVEKYSSQIFKYWEQKWVCSNTGESEWREVPTIYIWETYDN